MRKKSRKITTLIFVALLIVIGMIFILNQTSPKNGETSAPDVSSKAEPTQETKLPAANSNETPLDACIAAAKADATAKKIDYVDDSILVVFAKGVSFTDALDLINSNSLAYVGDNADSGSFEANGFLTAGVPKGEEFKWICALSQDKRVKRAVLNTRFLLHE